MAEGFAIVGTIASVIQLVEVSTKVLGRLKEYVEKTDELPTAFANIDNRLPALCGALKALEESSQSHRVSDQGAAAILPTLQGCRIEVEKLQVLLSAMLANVHDSKARRLAKTFRSFWKESEVREIDAELGRYMITLTSYCTLSSYKWSTGNGLFAFAAWDPSRVLTMS